jgi:hypothetical protein
MITLRVDDRTFQRDMDRFARKSARGFMYAVDKATMGMLRFAKGKVRNLTRNSKVRSGTLINNIVPMITNKGMTGAVVSKASYSRAFEEGQRPHLIKIRIKKVLAGPKRGNPGWPMISGDYAIYGTKVVHPGTQPKPFMYPAWRFGMRMFNNLVKKALS